MAKNGFMLLNQMELRFRALRGSHELHQALARWSSEHPALAAYEEIEGIWKLFRDKSASYEKKNRVTIALCQLVQEDDELAMVALVELYAPSLRNSVGRNIGKSPLTVDELHAEAVDAFLAAARGVTPETEKVSGRLAGRVRDHLSDAVTAANKAQHLQSPMPPEGLDPLVETSVGSYRSAEDEMLEAWSAHDMLDRATRAGIITEDEAHLIEDTRPGSMSLTEAAQLLGEPYGTVKQRRRRAEKVLKAWLAVKKPPPRGDSGPSM
ncbi:MAG TPA: hypothetical protein VM784_06845 [Actinomycetota bacterium]|jgi:DNA-directed RNA polymerase specialized sigma24 family protein|nr:hypothetical protein [Actinomycetota bacterium]